MKKLLILTITTIMLFSGCGTKTYNEAVTNDTTNSSALASELGTGYGYFSEIKRWGDIDLQYRIVYAVDTKVKYLVYSSATTIGITPLYNADGILQIYEGE